MKTKVNNIQQLTNEEIFRLAFIGDKSILKDYL